MPPCWGLSVHKSRSHPCCSRRGWLFLSLICCDRQKMRFPPRWLFEVSGTGLAIRQQVQPPVPGAEPGQRPKGCQRANLRAPTTKSPSRLSCETLQVAGTPQGRRLSREHRFASVVNEPRGDGASRRSHNPPFRRTRRWLAPGRRSACTRCRATRAIVRTSAFGSLAELGVFFGIGGWHLWRWVAPATVINSEQPVARIAVLPLLIVMNQQTTAMIQQQVQKCRSK